MKFKYLFTAMAALLLSGAAHAVPAYPGVLTLKNPDGTTIELRGHGDEHFSYVTAPGSSDIYEQNAAGFWVRAQRNGKLLNADNRADLEMLMAEQGTVESIRSQAKYARVGADGRSMFPCTGANKFLIVLLEYKDTKFTMEDPQALYTRWFNEKNFTYQDMSHSAKDYYVDVSGGAFNPTFVVAPKIELNNTSSFYVGGDKYKFFYRAISEAFVQLNQQGFDFSSFDIDNDGILDNVFFIFAGYGQADTQDRTTIWPHKSSVQGRGYKAGNLTVGAYACSNELRGGYHYTTKDGILESIGTFCHEFGHVLGLPDLYDPAYSQDTQAQLPGAWTIMCDGPYMNDSRTPPTYTAYEKWVCHWLEFEDLENGKSYELQPLSEQVRGLRLKVPTAASACEYYVIESRSKTGWDEFVPGEGLLIWHVDFNSGVWDTNRVNSTPGRPRCTVILPADVTGVASATWPAQGLYGGIIANNMPNELKPFNALAGEFPYALLDITYNAETRKSSFNFSTTLQPYTGKTDHIEYNKFDWRTGFDIRWNAVPGAVKYAVTVKRTNSSGREFFVDGYNDKIITDTTCYVSESATIMKSSHWVEIRAIGSLPSTEVARSENFIPENLPASVEGVQDDMAEIEGGQGSITAPEQAVIYNIQGVVTGKENLPAGIYIVRYKGLTKKVLVK